MAGLASINIKFAADLAGFSSSMQNASRKIEKLGKQLQNVGAGLSIGVTAPFVAFSAIALKNWDKQEKAIAQVNAGLLTTGNAVGFTSKQLQQMASDLQNNSLFGDEEILQNATAQLLKFTNIAGDQFKRTQLAALDLATRLDGDLKSASIQLGKALNDPVANLSALSKSGIQFSEDQKTTINTLVKTNKLAEAQTLILDELQKQYGGSAEAAAKAGLGGFKQLQNSIGDVTEEFGAIIGKALLPFVEKIKGLVVYFQNLSPETKKWIVILGGVAAAIGPILVALGFLMTTVVPGLITAFGFLSAKLLLVQGEFLKLTAIIAANPFGALAVAIAAIASYFVFFNKEADKTIAKQNLLASVNDEAAKSIANEKAKLEELLFIAKNENIQKSARLKAIQELNKISPEFLGNLTLETINTDAARIAVEKYNLELIKTAKTKAAQSKLQEIQSKLIDLELVKEKASVDIALDNKKVQDDIGLSVAQRNKLLSVSNDAAKLGGLLAEKEVAELKNQEQQLLKIIAANQVLNKVVIAGGDPKVKGRKKVESTEFTGVGVQSFNLSDELVKEGEKIDTSLTKINESFVDFSNASSQIISGAAANVLAGFGTMIAGLANGSLTMGDVAGGLMKTIGDLAVQLGKAAIEIGVGMFAIKAAFANPFAAIAAGFALVAIGTLISSASNITSGGGNNYAGAFAEGGIIGGSSFSGDKLFARVNSGEMILNTGQQRNLLGALGAAKQQVNVVLEGGAKIVDRELIFFIEQANKRLNRVK